MSFPGGMQDQEDGGDHVKTALRETQEEIGVESCQIKVYGVGTCFSTQDRRGLIYPVVASVDLDFTGDPFHLNREEVHDVHLIPLKDLCNFSCWRYTRWKRPGSDNSIALPVYRDIVLNDCNTPRLWGITALITHFVLMAVLPTEYRFQFDLFAPVVAKDVV